jgi:hypothetical protein
MSMTIDIVNASNRYSVQEIVKSKIRKHFLQEEVVRHIEPA